MINLKSFIKDKFKPSFHRIFLTTISISVYRNTYYNSDYDLQSLIGALIFPSFYLAYMYIFYPENFNYKNKNPTIPESGFTKELSILKNSPLRTIYLFLILYLYFTYFLYEKKIKNLYSRFFS